METQNVKVCYVVNTNEEVKSIYKIDDTPRIKEMMREIRVQQLFLRIHILFILKDGKKSQYVMVI